MYYFLLFTIMMLEKPREKPRQAEPANINYPVPPAELTAQQQPVLKQPEQIFESRLLQERQNEQSPMQQNPIEQDNFARMPEDCFLSKTFQILSEKKRLKNRFELLDSILSPMNAPLVEVQAIE
jgi:hypothetical protein